MLANMGSDNLTVLWVGMRKNVLDKIIAVLVACDVDKRYPWAVNASLTHSIKVTAKEFSTADLQTLFNNLGGELVHRVLRGVPNNMVNGSAPVCRGSMLANVLDTPITKLTVGHNVNVG